MNMEIKYENGCQEVYYGNVKMPHYAGVKDEAHQVTADWNVGGVLDDGRTFEVFVSSGFVFDGCSIPRLLWRVCGEPFEAPRIAAALAHDWLYAAHVCEREIADEIFRNICKQVGIGSVRRAIEYRALRWFGGSSWREHGENDEAFARVRGSLCIGGERQNPLL